MRPEIVQGFFQERKVTGRWNDFLACKANSYSPGLFTELSTDTTIQPVFQRKAIDEMLEVVVSTRTWYVGFHSEVGKTYKAPTIEDPKKWFSRLSEDNRKYAANQIINSLEQLGEIDASTQEREVNDTGYAKRSYSLYLVDALSLLDEDTAGKAIESLYLELDYSDSDVINACYQNEEIPIAFKKRLAERAHVEITKELPPNRKNRAQENYFRTLYRIVDRKHYAIDDEFLLSELDAVAEIAPHFIDTAFFDDEKLFSLFRGEKAKRAVMNYLKEGISAEGLDSHNQLYRLTRLSTAGKIFFPEEEMAEVDARIKELKAAEDAREAKRKQDEANQRQEGNASSAKNAEKLERAINSLRKSL